MLIISIDPGTVNLGYYVGRVGYCRGGECDENRVEHIQWGTIDLAKRVEGKAKPSSTDICKVILDEFIPSLPTDEHILVLVESQMYSRMQLVAHTFWTYYYPRCVMVSPRGVKHRLGPLETCGGHDQNKKQMVDLMLERRYIDVKGFSKDHMSILHNAVDAYAMALDYWLTNNYLKTYNVTSLSLPLRTEI
ncbi:hypothetical protein SAMD00019534_125610 [Acytostelium subglobosum LB1]|uniref:hypothetical protein n=1 Tax=Acytostelium subglobosum LB1 TaxID=1410327 RepID=UPI0006450541|nr:hypothetical protein SAMD00019534_125610 [Acytostelium subglobosum LB1]GAM29385.1 hypothetical protein SAMD00019534_125610 [Acytostelium subglobosum LB1]|eukprot:XP_012747653.1 hypothetical protein SAMD00019534_125610 [Acytostelium subglobosum LB1]